MKWLFIISVLSIGLCAFVIFYVKNVEASPQIITYQEVIEPTASDPNLDLGERLFKQNCTSCHKIDAALVGPPLKGVAEKYANDKKWLYAFVRNAQKLIKKGDPKAIKIYKEYGEQQMNRFTFLSKKEIDAIFYYVDNSYVCGLPAR